MKKRIKNVFELDVYNRAFETSMQIFELSRSFPYEERFSLTDQIRRSSRSVCANLAEAWRKRLYSAHFVSKLSDCAAEAEETRVWLKYSLDCGYIKREDYLSLSREMSIVVGQLVTMMSKPENWTLKN